MAAGPAAQYAELYTQWESDLRKALQQAARDAQRAVAAMPVGETGTLKGVRAQMASASLHNAINGVYGDLLERLESGMLDAAALGARVAAAGDVELLRALGMSDADARFYIRAEEMRAIAALESAALRVTSTAIPLSQQVYRTAALSRGMVDRTVTAGLARGLNARDLAASVRQYIDPATPGGVSYAAQRLARTEINNAYHQSAINRIQAKPWNEAVRWHLSGSHPTADICNDYAEANNDGIGSGLWQVGSVPAKPHPQCLCYITAVRVPPDEFIKELQMGKYDSHLDDIMGRSGYTQEFINSSRFKPLGASRAPLGETAYKVKRVKNLDPDIELRDFGMRDPDGNPIYNVYHRTLGDVGTVTKAERRLPVTNGRSYASGYNIERGYKYEMNSRVSDAYKASRGTAPAPTSLRSLSLRPLGEQADAMVRDIQRYLKDDIKLLQQSATAPKTFRPVTASDLPTPKLAAAEQDALNGYQWDNGKINTYLRKSADDPAAGDAYLTRLDARPGAIEYRATITGRIEHIDDVMARSTISDDVVLWRGIDSDAQSMFSRLKVGDVVTDNGYMSTTVDRNMALKFADGDSPVVLRINTPAGTHGVRLDPTSHFGSETEVLLDRGMAFRATRITDEVIDGRNVRVVEGVLETRPSVPVATPAKFKNVKASDVPGPKIFSESERVWLSEYQESSYPLNDWLRHGGTPRMANVDDALKTIDDVMARSAIPDDIIVYRGIDAENAGDVWRTLKPGDQLLDRAFMSTSTERFEAETFLWSNNPGNVLLEIRVPKGSRGFHIDVNEFFTGQSEILLDRGATMRITDIVKTTVDGNPVSLFRVTLEQPAALPPVPKTVPKTAAKPKPAPKVPAPTALTAEEALAVDIYQSNATITNGYLRYRAKGHGAEKAWAKKAGIDLDGTTERIQALDRVMERHALQHDTTLWRGIEVRRPDVKRFDDLKPGDVMLDHGFVSTTADAEMAGYFAEGTVDGGAPFRAIFEIDAKRGARGFEVRTGTVADGEAEFLLDRGSHFRVVSVDRQVTRVSGGQDMVEYRIRVTIEQEGSEHFVSSTGGINRPEFLPRPGLQTPKVPTVSKADLDIRRRLEKEARDEARAAERAEAAARKAAEKEARESARRAAARTADGNPADNLVEVKFTALENNAIARAQELSRGEGVSGLTVQERKALQRAKDKWVAEQPKPRGNPHRGGSLQLRQYYEQQFDIRFAGDVIKDGHVVNNWSPTLSSRAEVIANPWDDVAAKSHTFEPKLYKDLTDDLLKEYGVTLEQAKEEMERAVQVVYDRMVPGQLGETRAMMVPHNILIRAHNDPSTFADASREFIVRLSDRSLANRYQYAANGGRTSGMDSGWFVRVDADVDAFTNIVTHEYGHIVDYGLTAAERKEALSRIARALDIGVDITEDIYSGGEAYQAITSGVSRYATTNGSELMAELFDEVINSSTPRAAAQAYRDYLIEIGRLRP